VKRQTPEINAGSMADIAFLLLIFWLVATTIKADRGIPNVLEYLKDKTKVAVPTKASDIIRVNVNEKGVYIIEGVELTLDEVGNEILGVQQVAGFKSKLVVTAHYDAPYKEYMELLALGEQMKIKTIENEIKKKDIPEGGAEAEHLSTS